MAGTTEGRTKKVFATNIAVTAKQYAARPIYLEHRGKPHVWAYPDLSKALNSDKKYSNCGCAAAIVASGQSACS